MKLTTTEEALKNYIRKVYPDNRNIRISLRRLNFMKLEFFHAFTNVIVEIMQKYLKDEKGYKIGHIITYILALVIILIFIGGFIYWL